MDKEYENDSADAPLMPLLSLVFCRTLAIAHRNNKEKCDTSSEKKTEQPEVPWN